jgi:D-lactate dehydrogenase (cytochrome)
MVQASNAYSKLTLPETPMLFLEFHGSEASVAEQSQRFAEIAQANGGGPFAWTTNTEERSKLWQARHDSYWASLGLRPGGRAFATDVCVPISKLADCMEETQADLAKIGLIAPIVGHVGDGNFHVSPIIDMSSREEVKTAEAFGERLAMRAIGMGGTCTGEHGVGQKKIPYLVTEHGEDALDLMRRLKAAIDPQNLFNPGKIFTA